MSPKASNLIWLDEIEVCTIGHLVETSGMSRDEVDDLVVSGVIWPVDPVLQPCHFHLVHVLTVRQARRLRDDFELDSNGVALAMTLLRRIGELELGMTLRSNRPAGN